MVAPGAAPALPPARAPAGWRGPSYRARRQRARRARGAPHRSPRSHTGSARCCQPAAGAPWAATWARGRGAVPRRDGGLRIYASHRWPGPCCSWAGGQGLPCTGHLARGVSSRPGAPGAPQPCSEAKHSGPVGKILGAVPVGVLPGPLLSPESPSEWGSTSALQRGQAQDPRDHAQGSAALSSASVAWGRGQHPISQ